MAGQFSVGGVGGWTAGSPGAIVQGEFDVSTDQLRPAPTGSGSERVPPRARPEPWGALAARDSSPHGWTLFAGPARRSERRPEWPRAGDDHLVRASGELPVLVTLDVGEGFQRRSKVELEVEIAERRTHRA